MSPWVTALLRKLNPKGTELIDNNVEWLQLSQHGRNQKASAPPHCFSDVDPSFRNSHRFNFQAWSVCPGKPAHQGQSQSHTKPSYTASLGSRDHNVLLSHDRKNMLPPLSSPMAHCYTILLWRVSGVKVRPNQLRTLSPPLSDCLCIIYIIYMWIMELPTSSQLIRSGATKLWYSDDILCRWSVISSIDLHCTTDCKHELLHLLPLCWREFKLNKVSGYLLISY